MESSKIKNWINFKTLFIFVVIVDSSWSLYMNETNNRMQFVIILDIAFLFYFAKLIFENRRQLKFELLKDLVIQRKNELLKFVIGIIILVTLNVVFLKWDYIFANL